MLNRVLKQALLSQSKQAAAFGRNISTSAVRNGGGEWFYRSGPVKPDRTMVLGGELFGGFMWWWILWHFWHEPGHVFGEFEYPDASKWSNQELGIPADDE